MALTAESKGLVYGFFAVSAFALTLPATHFAVPFFDPFFVGLGRAVVAGFFAILLLLFFKQQLPTVRQLKRLFVVALGVVVGFPLLSSWAMTSLGAAHGGVVLGMLPLATAMMAVLVSNERPTVSFWLASVMGTLLVVGYSLLQGGGSFSQGDGVLFGAMLLAAIGYAVGGALARELGGWQVICWSLVIALPFVFWPAVMHLPSDNMTAPSSAWYAFLYLALVSQLLAFVLWNTGLAMGGVARVSQVQLMQPFITIVASFLLLGETIDTVTIMFAMAVAAVVMVGKRAKVSG